LKNFENAMKKKAYWLGKNFDREIAIFEFLKNWRL
jgi:hypothetical protein